MEKTTQKGALCSVLFTRYYLDDQVNKNEMEAGYVLRIRGGAGKVHRGFWSRDLMKRYHLQDQVMDGRIILKWILNKSYGKHGLD